MRLTHPINLADALHLCLRGFERASVTGFQPKVEQAGGTVATGDMLVI